jgi:RNA methyltransferase, TrmH family
MKHISSASNRELTHLRKLLQDRAYRYEQKQFVAEGYRSLEQLRPALTDVYCVEGAKIPAGFSGRVVNVDSKLLYSISEVESSQGMLGICKLDIKDRGAVSRNGRYVFLDRIQDPGNMGTIIRTAVAFGIKGVIVNKGCVDPYSPKVVRSTAGSIISAAIISAEFNDIRQFNTLAADSSGASIRAFREKPADFILCIGNEAAGLSGEIVKSAKEVLSIPQSSNIESLNAAIAAGIFLYQLCD